MENKIDGKLVDRWKKRMSIMDDSEKQAIFDAVIQSDIPEDRETNDGVAFLADYSDTIEHEFKSWGKPRGLLTGFKSLDARIMGMNKGDYILIAGETNNGKSAVALNIIHQVGKTQEVLYITLEMLIPQLGARLRHMHGEPIDDLKIAVQTEHRINYKDLKPIIKNAVEGLDVKLVVLDYLQYLGRGMKIEEVAIISKEIKTLALEFEIPIIVIVSLRKNSAGAQRPWTSLTVDDISGTGSTGYDADTILLVSRKDLDNNFDAEHVWMRMLKARNCALDPEPFKMLWDKTKISDDNNDWIPANGEIKSL